MKIDIEERVAKAKKLFKEDGYNCCQAVVLAYNDIFCLDDKMAASLSSGFGGGMGSLIRRIVSRGEQAGKKYHSAHASAHFSHSAHSTSES